MGRDYSLDEWLQFLVSDEVFHEHGLSDELQVLQTKFETRICDMLDKFADDKSDDPEDLYYNEHDPACTVDECVQNTAYLSLATIAGHGIGLWEGQEPWHEEFEVLVKADDVLLELAREIEAAGYACHLLPMDGVGTACGWEDPGGDEEWTDSDINMVTCPRCIELHEEHERLVFEE